MAFKLVVLSCLVAAASAGLLPAAPVAYSGHSYQAAPVAYSGLSYQAAPVAYSGLSYQAAPVTYAQPIAKVAKVAVAEPYDPNPQYSFAYDVQDGLTGDSKSQQESRSGDVVQGSYSVVDPDGVKRTVEYTADPHNGFNAVVHREPLAHVAKVAVAPVAKIAAPLTYAAPVAKIATPLTYAAPVAKIAAPLAYSAPVVQSAYSSPLAYSSSLIHH